MKRHGNDTGRHGYETSAERGEPDVSRRRLRLITDGDGDLDPPLTRAGKARLRSLSDLDQRTAAARKARELIADLERDLGGFLTAAQRELVQRAAILGAIVEDHETRWIQRKAVDLNILGMLADRQRRILESLGLGRSPRNVTMNGPTRRVIEALRADAND